MSGIIFPVKRQRLEELINDLTVLLYRLEDDFITQCRNRLKVVELKRSYLPANSNQKIGSFPNIINKEGTFKITVGEFHAQLTIMDTTGGQMKLQNNTIG